MDDLELPMLQSCLCSGLTCRQAIHNPAQDKGHIADDAHLDWPGRDGSLSLDQESAESPQALPIIH